MIESRASYKVEVAWGQNPQGLFTIGHSLLGSSTDLLAASSWDQTFTGTYDNITSPGDGTHVDEIAVVRGRDDRRGVMQGGRITTTIRDPIGKFNHRNPASVLYGQILPMKPCRVSAVGPGLATLTVSGNEITDATRAAVLTTTSSGQMMDGRTNDSSYGIRRAATNLFRRGQCDAVTDWIGGGSSPVVAVDATVPAPFSPQSIKLTSGGIGLNSIAAKSATGQAIAAGTVCPSSVYFLGVAGLGYSVRTRIVNTDATNTDSAVTNFVATGAWQLLIPPTATVAVGKTGDAVEALVVQTGSVRVESVWAAHAMLEKGQSVVAPYVATSGGVTATHAAGRVQAPSTLINATQGWVAARVRMGMPSPVNVGGDSPGIFSLGDGTTGHRIGVFAINATSQWQTRRTDGSGLNATVNDTWNAGDMRTVICKWDATTISLSIGGAPFVTVNNGGVPTVTAFDIGQTGAGANWLNGDVLWFACGTGTLTDGDAATINGWGNQVPVMNAFPTSAAVTSVWDAIDNAYVYPGQSYPVAYAFLDTAEWDAVGTRGGTATLTFMDFFVWLQRQFPVIANVASTTTGAAIGMILDAVGWTSPALRNLDVGDSIVNFAMDGTISALDRIDDLLASERGVFFVAASGAVTYRNRSRELTQTPKLGIGGAQSLKDVVSGMRPGLDHTTVINKFVVTDQSGIVHTSSDATSIRIYGEADSTLDALYTPTAQGNYLAQWLVLDQKDPSNPAWDATVRNVNDRMLASILAPDISDRITLSAARAGIGSSDYIVEQINHTIKAGGTDHEVAWKLTEMKTSFNPFIVGSSLLGSTDILVY